MEGYTEGGNQDSPGQRILGRMEELLLGRGEHYSRLRGWSAAPKLRCISFIAVPLKTMFIFPIMC